MSIPKRPLAVSKAKKTLPLTIDWGEGIPKDRLRYINAREEGLIKAARSTTAVRSHAGVTAYADDSASSKGVERGASPSRGADGPAGVGRGSGSGGPAAGAGPGPNSPSSSSSSASSSTGGGAKSSSSSTPASSPAKAPNAAAQAASNKLNGVSGASRPTTNAAAASVGISRPPNAAAAAASDRLKAMDKATAASKATSVQSLINSGATAPNAAAQAAFDKQRMAAMSQRYDPIEHGQIPNPKGALPGAAPGDFVRTGLGYNTNKMDKMGVTDANRIVDGFKNITQFKDVTYNPDQVQAIKDRYGYTPVGIRENNPGNLRPPKQEQWQKDIPGYTGPVTSPNGTVYQSYTDPRWGLVGQNELLGKYHDWGRTTINGVVDKYAPVAERENTAAQNQNYKDHLSRSTGWGLDQELTREQVQSLGPYKTTFENGGQLFAGGPFGGTPSGLGSAGLAAGANPSGTSVQQRMADLDPPTPPPGNIPSPTGGPMMPGSPRTSQNMQAPPGWGQERVLGVENYVDATGIRDPAAAQTSRMPSQAPAPQMSALPGFSPPGLNPNFRGTAGVATSGMVPGWGYSPSADGRMTADSNDPSTYSPQSSPEDAPVYSDNPVQGPSNPMQDEGENPQVKRDRQMKYASRGATLGGLIAGHIGTAVGATLGWQMGKTSPQQRMAIASNPQALQANVRSINEMVEDRGGKGNPNLTVTEAGLKDVLENPQKVTANPQAYTSLEQQLAALSQGIDPATGKPV